MQKRTKGTIIWSVLLGVPTVVDIYYDRKDPELTLSHNGRAWFRLETLLGQVAFLSFWTVLSKWFIPHMVRPAQAARRARAVSAALAATKE